MKPDGMGAPSFAALARGGTTAVALLVPTTIHNSRWAVAYLLVFGIAYPQWVPLTSRQVSFVLAPSLY
jgi:hypothetical protein